MAPVVVAVDSDNAMFAGRATPALKNPAKAAVDKPVTEDSPALESVIAGGAPLPSVKEFAPAASPCILRAPASANPLPDPVPRSMRRATPTGTPRPRSFPWRSPTPPRR